MPVTARARPDADEAPRRYARWLAAGARIGLGLLVLGFIAYIVEAMEAHVPIERLPELWHLPADQFLAQSGVPPGWGWTKLVHRGDLFNLLGITVLASASIPCLIAAMPVFHARGERAFVAFCALEIAVMLVAASGVVSAH